MLTTFFITVRRWRSQGAVRNHLAGLSDAQLHDIGIARTDIDIVASGKHPRVARND